MEAVSTIAPWRRGWARAQRDPTLVGGAVAALLSGLSYLSVRIYLQAQIGAGGTGALQYESYYPLAFARELRREGNWLLFRNPFGSLDRSPHLFDGPASLARLTLPLWEHHLFAFDLAAGTALSLVAGWFFGRLAFRISRHDAATTLLVIAFVILGNGFGYLLRVVEDGGLGGLTAPLIWGSTWGLSWQANNLQTWEVLYHAIFWAGLYAAVTGRRGAAIVAAVALTLLHPFTLAIYLFALAALALFQAPARRAALPAAGIAIAGLFIWSQVIPRLSNDARFFHHAYQDVFVLVLGHDLLWLFLAPAVVLLAAFIVGRDWSVPLRDGHALWLVAAALPLFVIAFYGRPYLPFVPQPAHWTRVYPIAFLALAAVALKPGRLVRFSTAVAVVLLAIGMVDGALANFAIGGGDTLEHLPIWLAPDERSLIAELNRLPPRRIVYVRPCGGVIAAGPELEYTIAALTDQQPPFGHGAFSPDLRNRLFALRACGAGPRLPPDAYVLTETRLLRHPWPRAPRGPTLRFGPFALFVRTTAAPAS